VRSNTEGPAPTDPRPTGRSNGSTHPARRVGYVRPYESELERTEAFGDFLHLYNHHRSHTALGGKDPISRVDDLAVQYT
jgi:transposase InsO family protein